MSVFWAPSFSLGYDADIIVTVKAKNAAGFSDASTENTGLIKVRVKPTGAPVLSEGGGTTHSQVDLTWTAITTSPDDGGSTVTDYGITWDQGIGSDTTLVASTSGLTTYTQTSGISPAGTYVYKVYAINVYGNGADSNDLTVITPATVPDQPTAPTTVHQGGSNDFLISWTAPSDGGSAITGYTLRIEDNGGTLQTPLTSCLGLTATPTNCVIPEAELAAAPFNLASTDTVKAAVIAANAEGSSPESASGGAAVYP
mmetsp:Transcript_9439/g.8963  ORF Transcript_9439/g.8963 Transcript_9439/m.8963 type:complete len:256 (+) Transcript_9439:6928-7695(+)